jgi:hypothetical protein
MPRAPTVDVQPLAARTGKPVLYAVLGATFHLELLVPEDAARFEQVNALVLDWIGPHLRSQFGSFLDVPGPFERGILDYVASLAEQLDDVVPTGDADVDFVRGQIVRRTHTDYNVYVSGSEAPRDASPFTYELWAEMPDGLVHEGRIGAYATLRITVPETWPIADFQARVLAIAACLRLRWGSAGFGYSHFLSGDATIAPKKIWAHARRHIGFDVPWLARNLKPFHDAIRSINWLTFLGPALIAAMPAPPTAGRMVEIAQVGDGIAFRAGHAPERGDVNRLFYPPAYVEADQMLRSVRLADAKDLTFFGPWTADEIASWLRRFERRLA